MISYPAPGYVVNLKAPLIRGFGFKRVEFDTKNDTKMNYSTPKLCIPKTGNDWYVHFRVQNPKTKDMEQFRERRGLNKIKDLKERKRQYLLLAGSLNKDLSEGWSPFNPGEAEPEKDKNRLNFYWWFDEKIAFEKARKKGFYNWRKLSNVKKKLELFSPKLSIHEIDYKFLKDFESHLLKEGASLNYIADILTRIKVIMTIIVKSGDIQYHKNPFNNFKSKTEKTKRTSITLEDIYKLKNIFLKNPNEKQARDMYIFSFYLAGMRFGDICRVKKSWFQGDHAHYTMNKSGNERKIKIMPGAQEIIKRYSRLKGEYLFPIKIDWENELKSISDRNAFYNKLLKRACKEAKIPEVSYHTARHSIADLAKNKSIDIHTLKDMLGHSKVATTERYMRSFYSEETDLAMDKLFE